MRESLCVTTSLLETSDWMVFHLPPGEVPQIEVKFDIDANGILSVSATDKGTGKKQDIKISGASTLSSDEVDRMVKDAESNAEEDKKKRDAVDTRNQVGLPMHAVAALLMQFTHPCCLLAFKSCSPLLRQPRKHAQCTEVSVMATPSLHGIVCS